MKYGVYQKPRGQYRANLGHTDARSALVKRDGKHVVFKSKRAAEQWALENQGDREYYVRRVSKEVTV